ncbi:MAG TPA: N-acetyltransferase [Candidatus Intestinimonas stercoravium]|uniref:GNAT family N-acetyltransferase n=1 Tax=uncultured Intestinimonas sp. TaxID=1689265 RepID=UPI001F8533DD|nr:GNAT family N-acetyltransferase [uncultured Intestinimonas sp.]HJA62837.1 N-acetyltransferase [Candidatus Intestinimonas stercoravium]
MRFERETGRIFARDESGKLLAEVTFPDRDGAAEIDHTFVDPSLEGRGVAGQLLQAAADALRAEGRKVRPTCSYAVRWFEKHPEQRDLLE